MIRKSEKELWSYADCFGKGPFEFSKIFTHFGYSMGLHTHDFYEINIIISGSGTHRIGDRDFNVTKGDIFVIPPGTYHGYDDGGRPDVLHILLLRSFTDHYKLELSGMDGYRILFEADPYIRQRMNGFSFPKLEPGQLSVVLNEADAAANSTGSELHRNIMVNMHALIIIGTLSAAVRTSYSEGDRVGKREKSNMVASCIELIRRDGLRDISTGTLADMLHVSPSTLYRVFITTCGETPAAFLKNYRIETAKKLLTETDETLSYIASACGFCDQSHMNKMFLSETGCKPSAYRTAYGKNRHTEV